MRQHSIALIWLAGIMVAVLAYAADPGDLLNAALHVLDTAAAAAERLVRALSAFGSDVVRALAIGLFAIFVALAAIAIQRGQRAWTALLSVSCVFVLLVRDGSAASNGRWVAAFALAAVAALVMTGRVRRGAP